MLGESVLHHPNKAQIDEMFNNGHTAEEVANWLKQVQKDQRLRTSKVSLQYYRKNILKLTRSEINQRRNEMLALGKNHDANVLTSMAVAKDFINAKTIQKEEIDKAVNEFKSLKEEAHAAIKLIKEQSVDDQGRPVFIPRHYEILEKMLGRIESANNSFIKSYSDAEEKSRKEAAGNTTININQVERETTIVKNAMKRILMEIDASKVARFWEIMREEGAKADEESGVSSGLRIEINNTNSGNTNINITTSLPSPEEIDLEVKDDVNENTIEHIVDVDVDPSQQN